MFIITNRIETLQWTWERVSIAVLDKLYSLEPRKIIDQLFWVAVADGAVQLSQQIQCKHISLKPSISKDVSYFVNEFYEVEETTDWISTDIRVARSLDARVYCVIAKRNEACQMETAKLTSLLDGNGVKENAQKLLCLDTYLSFGAPSSGGVLLVFLLSRFFHSTFFDGQPVYLSK